MFKTVNDELVKVNDWFASNKLSINSDETKFTFFHKLIKDETIPLLLPKLKINNTFITRENFTKFLGVMSDENVLRKPYKLYIKQKFKEYGHFIQS